MVLSKISRQIIRDIQPNNEHFQQCVDIKTATPPLLKDSAFTQKILYDRNITPLEFIQQNIWQREDKIEEKYFTQKEAM